MSTQQLLDIILKQSPKSDPETVLELLASCNGDLKQTLALLGVQSTSKKRQMTLSGIVKAGTTKHSPSKPPTKAPANPSLNSSNIVHLFTPDQVEQAEIDCILVENALGPQLADKLLLGLMTDSKSWKQEKFYLFDRQVISPHLSEIYTSNPQVLNGQEISYQGRIVPAEPFTPEISEAREMVQNLVQSRTSATNWKSDLLVANRYDGPQSGVGYHSDQLTHLGPRPTIAGLSLGADREFRLKLRSERKKPTQYSIHCRHNSLVIMLPGCQERWKHSIPQVKAVDSHLLSGTTRISLTFRMYPDEYRLENLPKCNCNKPMILRTTVDEKYKYIWQCSQAYVSNAGCRLVKDAVGVRIEVNPANIGASSKP